MPTDLPHDLNPSAPHPVPAPGAGSPAGPTDGSESHTQRVVGQYLTLVDRHGADDPAVRAFRGSHPDVPELAEWAEVIGQLAVRGQAGPVAFAPPPAPAGAERFARLGRAALAVSLTLFGCFGVIAMIARGQTDAALVTARAERATEAGRAERAEAQLGAARRDREQDQTIHDARLRESRAVVERVVVFQVSTAVAYTHLWADSLAADAALASKSDELDKIQVDWAEAKSSMARAESEAQRRMFEANELKDKYEEWAVKAQLAIEAANSAHEEKSPERAFLINLTSSRVESGDIYVPWPRENANRLLPESVKGTAGLAYGRATLLRGRGGEAYERLLKEAATARDRQWEALAQAELVGRRHPEEFKNTLTKLSQDIQTGLGAENVDPTRLSHWTVQREVGLRAFAGVYRSAGKEAQEDARRELVTTANQKDTSAAQRVTVYDMLGEVGWDADADRDRIVLVLAAGLRSEAAVVRWHAARNLGEFGPGAGRAYNDLRRLAEDDRDERVREQARRAAARVGSGYDPFRK